jgi:hypothetical protein
MLLFPGISGDAAGALLSQALALYPLSRSLRRRNDYGDR